MAEDSGDRRELDKLRAQLESERFASLRELIETRFTGLDEKLDRFSVALDGHIKQPHNLAALTAAVSAVPPLPVSAPVVDATARDEQGFWRTVSRNWKIVGLILGIPAIGGGGYAFRGCGPFAGTEIHVHDIAAMTATAGVVPAPTPMPAPTPKATNG